MAATFLGNFEHVLDSKGRVFLPARFRGPFRAGGGYLSRHLEGCVALWTPEIFEVMSAEMAALARGTPAERNRARYWASECQDVTIDGQGRMPIPARLREFASLEGEVVVAGSIDHVELWSPARWQGVMEGQEEWMRGEAPPPGT